MKCLKDANQSGVCSLNNVRREASRHFSKKEKSLANPARNAYAPYCDVICGPSVSTIFFNIFNIFEKKLLNIKYVF